MSSTTKHDLAELISALADSRTRAAEAVALAKRVGAMDLTILLRDPELGILRPAPGFPQTLAGGPTWAELLAACDSPGRFRTTVAHPGVQHLEPADVWVGDDGTVLLLIGGEPLLRAWQFADASKLLFAMLQSEAREDAAVARARSAGDVTQRATALASSLDQARAKGADNARALAQALSEAARLNRELQLLNETLEQRVHEEIAERMKVEDALRQAQKMEAIGQLTGGVAHDFNNLLTVIIGGLDNMSRYLDADGARGDDARLRRALHMATHSAERAATLTARLLAFSRRQALNPEAIQVDRLVRDIGELLQRSMGEQVDLELVGSAGLWPALADPNELEQAILNLAVNARDAMSAGGKLTIETANVFLDEAYLSSVPEPVSPGQYVKIAVSDTGEGMNSDTLSRVFEPFFTTKETGKGTGLGLSQVYGFVRQSGGHVRMYSEVGQGTTAKLYLPRFHGEVAAAAAVPRLDVAFLRGNETVLLVEDDEGVRAYSSGVLRELGYNVIEASDAASALAALKESAQVDLLFTDVVLPGGLHGHKLAEEVRKQRQGIRVLFASGYTRNAMVHNGRLDAGVQLITKPFTYNDLAERVRRVLDAG